VSSRIEIPLSIYGQEVYLENSIKAIIEAAGEYEEVARFASNRVLRALAYNGTEYRHAADTIVGEAGRFLETISPEAGRLLSEFSQIVLEGKIDGFAVVRFLGSESRKISLYSQIPAEDFPFYQMIQQGGLSLPEKKLVISEWLLGLEEIEPTVAAKIEAGFDEEANLELLRREAKRALRRATEAVLSGSSFSEEDIGIVREYGQQMLTRGLKIDDIVKLLKKKSPNK